MEKSYLSSPGTKIRALNLGTDVFAQNVSRDRHAKLPDFCFPPLHIVGKFLEFAEWSKAWCVVVIPEKHATWAHV